MDTIALPTTRPRPLKRSASTASLPTPPRTRHKRKSILRGSNESEEEEEEDVVEDDIKQSKKRRLDGGGDEDEDSFWLGSSKAKGVRPTRGSKRVSASRGKTSTVTTTTTRTPRSPSTSVSPTPLLYRTRGKAPVSPPPSHRQKKVSTLPLVGESSTLVIPSSSPPSTPKRGKRKGIFPVRDSGNNPFLLGAGSPMHESPGSEPPVTPKTPFEEKPTLTYVFRGVKGQFINPQYNLSPSALALSALPIEHEDYVASEACPPKLLFPEAHQRARRVKPLPKPRSQVKGKSVEGELPKTPSPRRSQRLQTASPMSVDAREIMGRAAGRLGLVR